MAKIINKATRESFGLALCELAKTHDDIVVLDADLAAAAPFRGACQRPREEPPLRMEAEAGLFRQHLP